MERAAVLLGAPWGLPDSQSDQIYRATGTFLVQAERIRTSLLDQRPLGSSLHKVPLDPLDPEEVNAVLRAFQDDVDALMDQV
jgi:hypothetical protein